MTLRKLFLSLFLCTPLVQAVDKTSNQDLNSRLKLAATNYDRHAILDTDDSWTYDFNHAHPQNDDAFKPGSVKNANAATFPALAGLGMTLAQLNLGPCAMLAPHMHPRATNLVIGIKGNTTSYMHNENGVRTVAVNLMPGIMTVFPKGSLHTMQNNDCTDSYLISALDAEDTGTLNILNGLWSLPEDMIKAGFGKADLDAAELGKEVPAVGTGSVMGSAECMKRCNMQAQ